MTTYPEIKNKIVDFIRYRTKIANTTGAIIGLSGGIDSTLVAYLTTEALKPNNVLGLLLPEKDMTHKKDIEDAIEIAKILSIDYKIIDISNILISLSMTIKDYNKENKVAIGNLKARTRMSILYYYANTMNRMVIGTGNKTELLLGYFTKYGDGGVDIEPIGDLYKTQVRELSCHLNIPSKIIKKIPTAGLWPGQTDEDELGITYETIDKILSLLIDKKQDISVVKKFFPPEQVDRLLEFIHSSEHKRILAQYCNIEN